MRNPSVDIVLGKIGKGPAMPAAAPVDAGPSEAEAGPLAAADQFLQAVHSKDPKAVVDAFRAMSDACTGDTGEGE